ncbi:MAG: NUDIX hydrolase [Deltaproteobacteria bacterium]|nr:NUDIX hydrolase [Deltaproteobacteria bacterium]
MIEGHRNPVPTVDVIIELGAERKIVLIERKNEPHGWAIPGGFVDYGERLPDAARREAKEETGLTVELECLLGVYSDPARDPRLHTVSAVYVGRAEGEPVADDDAASLALFPAEALPAQLCFDHRQILDDYLAWRERGELPRP